VNGPESWDVVSWPKTPNDTACPAAFRFDRARGSVPSQSPDCVRVQDGNICACECVADGMTRWECRAFTDVQFLPREVPPPSPLPTCPAQRPLLGDACPAEFEAGGCDYGAQCGGISFGPSMTFLDGYWHEGGVPAWRAARPRSAPGRNSVRLGEDAHLGPAKLSFVLTRLRVAGSFRKELPRAVPFCGRRSSPRLGRQGARRPLGYRSAGSTTVDGCCGVATVADPPGALCVRKSSGVEPAPPQPTRLEMRSNRSRTFGVATGRRALTAHFGRAIVRELLVATRRPRCTPTSSPRAAVRDVSARRSVSHISQANIRLDFLRHS